MDEQLRYTYHAVAREPYDIIERNAIVTFESTQLIEKPSALTFRREIADACRNQFGCEIADDEVATLSANFDVYTEEQFAAVKEKLDAAAEKERQRQELEANKGKRTGKGTAKTKGTSTTKPRLTTAQLKKALKWVVGAILVIWFVSTQLKVCSLSDLTEQARNTIEEMSTTKNTKKPTTKKASTTTKKSTTAKKKSTTAKKKSTTTTNKPSSTARKSSSTTKKGTSTTKKKSSSTAKKSSSKKSTTKK
jgi:hypothetical protein